MLIKQISVRGLLSFGSDGITLPLTDLNVLIGPNGSGKSNFIEIISLLKASCLSLPAPMKEMGGVREWFWKGPSNEEAQIEALILNRPHAQDLRHRLVLGRDGDRFQVADEQVENETPYGGQSVPYYFYNFRRGYPILKANTEAEDTFPRENIVPEESILSQVKDPGGRYPTLTRVQQAYGSIRLFRNWQFGPSALLRREQPTDNRNDFLSEGGENLALVLSKIKQRIKPELRTALRELFSGIDDIDVVVDNGAVQLFLEENGRSIPSTRLSDGTLRFLCLLAILLHPDPPGLVAIEEPELGLHPDILPYLGKLIKNASKRMQLVITTHSQILLDAFSESPEDVIVCSRGDGESRFERLSQARLADWLNDHTLGELWNMGEIGGNRW